MPLPQRFSYYAFLVCSICILVICVLLFFKHSLCFYGVERVFFSQSSKYQISSLNESNAELNSQIVILQESERNARGEATLRSTELHLTSRELSLATSDIDELNLKIQRTSTQLSEIEHELNTSKQVCSRAICVGIVQRRDFLRRSELISVARSF